MAEQQNINDLLKEANRIKMEAKRLLDEESKGQKAIAEEIKKSNKDYLEKIARLREINELILEERQNQQQVIDSYVSQEKRLKGLTGLQASIASTERARLDMMVRMPNLNADVRDTIQSISDLQQELLQTSVEDSITKADINRKLDEEYSKLDGVRGVHAQLKSLMLEQRDIANSVSNLTEKQQQRLNQQLQVYEGIQDSIAGVLDTASLLTSNMAFAAGSAVFAFGSVLNKIGDVNKELGTSLFQADGIGRKAGLLSFAFEDAAGTAKALSAELGDTEAATFKAQASIGLMATNMGISNTEAVALSGSFARLNGNSTDVAADMVKTTQQFAKQNGIIPSQLMADLAGSAEQFALFGDEGGENILRAAGYAAKLGTNMSTLSGIAEGLLDFESSITKELELGAMLGKNINLNKARELAFAGDIEGATKATLDELGGIEAFNKMDFFQKKATAELLGVSVAELQKMAANQEKAATLGGVIQDKFSMVGETINAGLNKYLGTGLQGLGGMITMAGQLGTGFKALGVDMGGIVKSSAEFVKNMVKAGAQKVGGLLGMGSKAGGVAGVAGKAGGAATGAAGGAGSAMKGVGKGMGAGMKGIASGLAAFANPATLLGLAAVTAAIIGIGFALKIAAPGIKAFGEAVGSIVMAVGEAVKTIIGGLGDFFMKVASVATPQLALSILGLAGGFAALTASLASFAVVGLAAVPAMMAISAFGAVGSLLGLDGEAGGGSGDNELLNEIKGLREDLNNGKVAVYMDGERVTASVSKVVNRIGSNSYAIA